MKGALRAIPSSSLSIYQTIFGGLWDNNPAEWQAAIRQAVSVDNNQVVTHARQLVPFFSIMSPPPRILSQANAALAHYLEYLRAERDLEKSFFNEGTPFDALDKWQKELNSRIQNETLDSSQEAELIEQICIMLFMLQRLACETQYKVQWDIQPATTQAHLERVQTLNKTISHWSGWDILADLGRIVCGAFMVVVAGCAIATGFNTVIDPVVSLLASLNGEALAAAAIYLALEIRSYVSGHWGKLTTNGEKKVSLYGSMLATASAALLPRYMSSTTLSLSKSLGTVATQSTKAGFTKMCAITMGTAFTGIMGAHAMWIGSRMLWRDGKKIYGDRKLRGHADQFFKAFAPAPAGSSTTTPSASAHKLSSPNTGRK